MEACFPQDKLVRINQLLNSIKIVGQCAWLIGTLQFACKVVVPGRIFLQRAINLTSRFHHMRLNKEFFKDLAMWKIFLSKWNGRSFFLESTPTPTQNLELYTDAAGSIGFRSYFQGKWFPGHWPPNMQLNQQQGISIEWQELFPIVACAIWHVHPLLAGKRLQFLCDNLSVVSIINSGHSKTPRIMDLVRRLVLLSIQHNFAMRPRHVPGVSNEIADTLSRFQMQRFRALPPTPTRIIVPYRLRS